MTGGGRNNFFRDRLIPICVGIVKLQWRPWKSDGPLDTLLQRSMVTVSAIILLEPPTSDQNLDPDEKRKRDRARRSNGLERFVLALNDQQLVTGLAVLIAGYTNRCSRSLYHFNIISTLGWFSSTTHLSTLAILRAYLIDHGSRLACDCNARYLRSSGVSQSGTFSTQDNSLPVQCVFESFAPGGLSFLDIIQLVFILAFLSMSYADSTRRLYTFESDWSVQDWIVEVVVRPLIRNRDARYLERIVVSTPMVSKAEQGVTYRRLKQRKHWWEFCGEWVKDRSAFSRRVAEIRYLNQEMQNSFLGEIHDLLFSVSYGIAQVIINRNQIPTGGLSGDQNAISFGQLVPLLLIALPVLAAEKVYFDEC